MTYGRIFSFSRLIASELSFFLGFPQVLYSIHVTIILILIFVFRLSHAINLLPLSATTRNIPSSRLLFFPFLIVVHKESKKSCTTSHRIDHFFSVLACSQPILSCLPTLHCVHVYHPTKNLQTYTLYTIVPVY